MTGSHLHLLKPLLLSIEVPSHSFEKTHKMFYCLSYFLKIEYLLLFINYKNDFSHLAASGHSASVGTFDVIFNDVFVSFRSYLGNNLAHVSFQVLHRCRFVDIETTLKETPQNRVALNRMIMAARKTSNVARDMWDVVPSC